MSRFAYYGINEERTAHDVLLEVRLTYKALNHPLATTLGHLVRNERLVEMSYDDFLAALEMEYEESPLQWLRYMGPARFEQLRKCFLGENGGKNECKTNTNNLPGRHRHRPADSAGGRLADEQAGGG